MLLFFYFFWGIETKHYLQNVSLERNNNNKLIIQYRYSILIN